MNTYLFIFLTILSIVFIIASYYGIDRYIKLHINNTESYIENYKNLNKANTDKKVVISLSNNDTYSYETSILVNMKPVLKSILDQTVKVDMISLNVSFALSHKDTCEKIANIFECQDYGCATKFVPTILREDNADTIIIILNNNVIYGKDFIESIIDEYNKNKTAIISNKAILLTPNMIDINKFNSRDKANITHDWIIDCIKDDKKNFKYTENYKTINWLTF